MKRLRILVCLLSLAAAFTPLAHAVDKGEKETGLAAVYSSRLNGHRTSSGQVYNPALLTTAHKTLPYGTMIRVTNPKSHKSVTVRVNDRGPNQNGRILDLTPAAARCIGLPHNSMRPVELEVLSVGSGHTVRQPHS